MDNQVKLQVTEILTSELEPLKQKIAQVEEQLNNLSIPDKDELKEAISQEITKTLDENKGDSTKQEELQKHIFEIIEQQLETKISTWQKEKETLAREIEEASKYQAKLQDSLEKLASDIEEIKDRTSTEKLNRRVEELSLNFLSKDELKLLASQLKTELEEFITKQVPLAAAQVIREEINALLKEKR
jgi:predicted RNase H-like nuclease (RuvC/YqgF family)